MTDHVSGSGVHAGTHRWLTPLRVLLLLTAIACAFMVIRQAPCVEDNWVDNDSRYASMCYSDLPYLYVDRGLAERQWPYSGDASSERYQVMEYPVGIAYFAYGAAWLTQFVSDADLAPRRAAADGQVGQVEGVRSEGTRYVMITALLFTLLALGTVVLLAGTNRGRPWDALPFAIAPPLWLTGLINWDFVAVIFLAAALWAWARDRPVLTGVMVGLGTGAKLFPVFLLGALLVICLRQRRFATYARIVVAAAVTWALLNLPAVLTNREVWWDFWSFHSDRGADLGSIWLVLNQWAGISLSPSVINTTSLAILIGWCVFVLFVGLVAPQTPRLAQLALLIMAGFLLVNKVYSPQYVLLLLPLAVIAVPRWRTLLIWWAGEAVYFAAVWLYLGGWLFDAGGSESPAYWIAILIRMGVQVYLIGVVIRDIMLAHHDPVDREDPVPKPARLSHL